MSPEKINYLKEHLPYSLQMLRHTHQYLMKNPDGLDWNAYFESFTVHARNFDRFFTNKNPGNFKSSEFTSVYRNQNRKPLVEPIFQRMEHQVFHFGKRRPTGTVGKVDSGQINAVYKWLESEICKFYDSLPSERKSLWDLRIADPCKAPAVTINVSMQQSTSSAIVSVMTFTAPKC